MKFVCDNCHAQYVINDEKVGPNGVSVKCKKCQHRIVVKRPAPVEEDRASTIVMQNPIAHEAASSEAPTEPVTTREGASGSSIPILTPLGEKAPMTPFETGPASTPFDDDIGRAFDSVITSPGGANPLVGNSVEGAAAADGANSPWDAPQSNAPEESGDRDSTRVMDLSNLAGLTAQPQPEENEKKDDQKQAAPVSEWYVAIDEEQVGPLTVDGVKGHWEKGELSADSLVWKTGMSDWKPLSSVPELAHLVVPVPRPQAEEKKEPPAGATATGAQGAAPGVTEGPEPEPGWKPSAASALASLVKEELQALQNPAPKPEPAAPTAPAGGLLNLPEEPPAAPANSGSMLGDLPPIASGPAPAQAASSPKREVPVLTRSPAPAPAASPAPYAPPAAYAPPARSNGPWLAVGIGGGLLGVGAIVAVLFMTVFKPAPVEPVAQVEPPAAPVAQTPPPAAPPAAPAAAAPAAPATPEPPAAPAEETAQAAQPQQEAPAVAEAKSPPEPETKKEEPAPAAVAAAEPKKQEEPPARVASRERRTAPTPSRRERAPEREVKRPEPPPRREEVAAAPSRSKVDDDFERIFGGGSSTPAPAPKKAEKRARTAYVPPPPGGATRTKLGQSDIMEVVVGNKSAIKRCVDEQKSKDPGASGTIVMRWTIRPDGRTANVQTVTSEFKKSPMSSCMAAAIKGWRFPSYSGAQMAPIDFPFKF